MSNYPEWWDRSITIYNKCKDPDSGIVTWYSTQVKDICFWKDVGEKVTVGKTSVDTSSIICRIPKQDNFITPYEWSLLDDKSEKFTLKQGDIIVLGECSDAIDEYEKGCRSTDLLQKYHEIDSCMEIQKVAIDTMSGMISPHYRVIGV